MRRYGYNSRLFKDSLEEKRHYKLYKKGKLWLVAGISVFSSGLAYAAQGSASAKADTTETTAVTAGNSTATAGKADDTSAASDSVSPVATQAATASTAAESSVAASTESDTATADDSAKAATSDSDTTTTDSTDADTTAATDAAKSSDATSTDATKSGDDQDATKTTDADKTATDADKATDNTKTADKLTEYSKEAGQELVKQAAQAAAQVQDNITAANSLADSDTTDNIPRDDAIAALGTHTTGENQQVVDAVATADSIAETDKATALDNLNKALSIVNNMNDEVEQAGVLLASDKKGVQANVVANAQAAYEQVSLPSGVTTKLDAYGDLIVTASNDSVYQSVLANLAENGLVGSFRDVVDPAESASITLSAPNGFTLDADGNLAISEGNLNANGGSLFTINFNFSGNDGDTFFVDVPTPMISGGTTATDNAVMSSNADGSTRVTWTISGNGVTKKESISIRYGAGPYGSENDLTLSPDSGNPIPANTTGIGKYASYNGVIPDGIILPIQYGGTNLTTQSKKITITNQQNFYFSLAPENTVERKTDQTYVYRGRYNTDQQFNNFGNIDVVIDLPSDFVFDETATDYLRKNSMRAGLNELTYTVLAGNKLEITGSQDKTPLFSYATFYFAGHYQSGATGTQSWSVESLSTQLNADGSAAAPILKSNGAEKNYTANSSDYNSGHSYAVNPNITSFTETVGSTDVPSIDIWTSDVNSTDSLVIGNTSTNVIGNFYVQNTGNTDVDPQYTIDIPEGVISTGISLPLTQAIATNMDKDTTFNVHVDYSDGTSNDYTDLKSGTTLSSIDGTDVKSMAVPSGAHVTKYSIELSTDLAPDEGVIRDAGGYGNYGGEVWYSSAGAPNDNDVVAQAYTVLGHVGADVAEGTTLTTTFTVNDKNSAYTNSEDSSFTATKEYMAALTQGNKDLPAILHPGETYTTRIGYTYGANISSPIAANLNANGFRDSEGRVHNLATADNPNDQAGYAGNTNSIFEPVMYLTTPAQMQVQMDGDMPFTTSGQWSNVTAVPKISSFVNADGLTVYKVDYTGTGFNWIPNAQMIQVTYKVNEDATSALIPWNSSTSTGAGEYNGIDYVDTKDFANSGLTADNNAATKFGVTGESIAQFMIQGSVISAAQQTNQADLQNLYIVDANGNKIEGLSTIQDYASGSVQTGAAVATNNTKTSNSILILASEQMIFSGQVKDNQTEGNVYQPKGINNPVPNGTDAETIRYRLANNTSDTSTNIAGILNLPQTVTANAGSTPGTFKLELTGPVTEGETSDGTATVTYYSTQSMTMATDGKSMKLNNGDVYYFNSADGTSTTTGSVGLE